MAVPRQVLSRLSDGDDRCSYFFVVDVKTCGLRILATMSMIAAVLVMMVPGIINGGGGLDWGIWKEMREPKASTFQKEKPVPSGNVTGFKQPIVQNQGFRAATCESNDKEVSSDPFNIYNLLDKHTKEVRTTDTSTTIPYPPGFTPANDIPTCNNQNIPEAKSDRPPSRRSLFGRYLEEMINGGSNTGAFPMEGRTKEHGERLLEL
ncbi:hypothetical protein Tco_0012629 [Tanacetum coccineum]